MAKGTVRMSILLALVAAAAGAGQVKPWRSELYENWKALPEPPVTPYQGPFGGEARAFVGNLNSYSKTHPDFVKSYWDWKRSIGTYDPDKDPRPINVEFEKACIEDWRRMGYNCSYKGNVWTYRSGRYLKRIGMLGAIDQTLWGASGPPPPLRRSSLPPRSGTRLRPRGRTAGGGGAV